MLVVLVILYMCMNKWTVCLKGKNYMYMHMSRKALRNELIVEICCTTPLSCYTCHCIWKLFIMRPPVICCVDNHREVQQHSCAFICKLLYILRIQICEWPSVNEFVHCVCPASMKPKWYLPLSVMSLSISSTARKSSGVRGKL